MPGLVFDFYPRSPCGERHVPSGAGSTTWKFLSTLSLRRATVHFDPQARRALISIHALLAESDDNLKRNIMQMAISIHALLAESDRAGWPSLSMRSRFLSTLSLRRATNEDDIFGTPIGFLSTLSLRRATFALALNLAHVGDFYPRSPCGERHTNAKIVDSSRSISIHALLAESD